MGQGGEGADAPRREEDSLLQRVAAGDMSALETLYRSMSLRVFAVALAITGDPGAAEDLVQDTFVRAYCAASSYRPGSSPRAWLLTITRHLALDTLRRQRLRQRQEPGRLPWSGRAASGQRGPWEEDSGAHPDVVGALLRLGEVDRQVVVLHDIAGLTHAEVAAQLGIPAGTVRWRYRAALARLRLILKEDAS
jgi:RNA polymerase sigma-70 factor, ECF subfamily